ncbi:hypothetical protein ACFT8W_17585 [Streptomyces hygroscopicus]|uniref:hypothetical protein n=1 Tax=Streptomyces hygroscopicus TaxID=1912 RepID=UPI00362D97ED
MSVTGIGVTVSLASLPGAGRTTLARTQAEQSRGAGHLEEVLDVKGRYARQAAGGLSGTTGVDEPCEEPADPALRSAARTEGVRESAAARYALLRERRVP